MKKLGEQMRNEADRICDGLSDVDTTVNKLRGWAIEVEESAFVLSDLHARVGDLLRKLGEPPEESAKPWKP